MAAKDYFYALGRRKSSTARIRLVGGKGEITINGSTAKDYFDGSAYMLNVLDKPFAAVGNNKFDVSARVSGGGITGQAEAIQLAIAKALALMNEDLKGTLKRADLLGRDPREKERKKFGLRKARKQRQFTKR